LQVCHYVQLHSPGGSVSFTPTGDLDHAYS
jgi:hypothetical protein